MSEMEVLPITWESLLKAIESDSPNSVLALISSGIYAIENLEDLSPQNWLNNNKTNEGLTLLHLAAAYDSIKILDYFLERKNSYSKFRLIELADVNGLTPLLLAASMGKIKAVNTLLSAGANPIATSIDGKNLTNYVAACQSHEVFNNIVEKAAFLAGTAKVQFLSMAATTIISEPSEWAHNAIRPLFKLISNFDAIKLENNMSLLHFACMKGNVEVVEALAEYCVHFNGKSENGLDSPLHIAVKRNNAALVKAVLVHNLFYINEPDCNGHTALIVAADMSSHYICTMLISYGANVNETSPMGTALHVAVRRNLEVVTQMILRNSTLKNINAFDVNGKTSLFNAVSSNNVTIAKYLIEAKADVNKKSYKNAPIHAAVKANNNNMLRILLSSPYIKIDALNSEGCSPLIMAVRFKSFSMCRTLIEEGADINCKGPDGATVLHIAAREGFIDLVKILLDFSELKLDCLVDKFTPLHVATTNSHWSIVEALVEAGADINCVGPEGAALHIAADGGFEKIVKILLNYSETKVDCLDDEKYTPLHIATVNNHVSIVDALIEVGADINYVGPEGAALHIAVDYGNTSSVNNLMCWPTIQINKCDSKKCTPLMKAVLNGDTAIAELLIRRGADVNIKNKHGAPLHAAVKGLNVKMLRLLLSKSGIKKNALDSKGRSAIFNAVFMGSADIIELLLQFDPDLSLTTGDGSDITHAAAHSRYARIFYRLDGFNFLIKNKKGESGLSILKAANAEHLLRNINYQPYDSSSSSDDY